MSDHIIPNSVGLGNYPLKMHDMGDGSFAPAVFVGGGAIGGGGASLADQSVVDAAGVYWLVRDNGATLTYVNWATGAAGSPTAPVAPAGKLTGEQVRGTQYNVVTAGTGTAVGDVVEHVVVLNIATNPASVVSAVWLNLTQGSVLATAPTPASLAEIASTVAVASLPPLAAGTNTIGSVAISNASLPVTQSGAWTTGRTWALSGASDSVTATIAGTPAVSISGNPVLGVGSNLIGAVNLDIGGAAISAANPVPVIDAYTAPTSVAWTSATAANTTSAFNSNGYDTIIVTLVTNGSFAGGAVAFEVFDGVNWMPVKSANILNYTTTPGTITPAANATQGYQVPVAGFPQFRVRLVSALSAGTLTVTTIISSAPDTSVVTVGLDPAQSLPAGTNTIGAISNASFGISGTLPAFAATPTFVNAAYVAQASTTNGQTGPLVQGAVTSSAPAYASAQTSPLSLTALGGLRADMASYAGTALTGSVTAYGTAPTGNVFGVNASVTNTVSANITTLGGSTLAAAAANGSTNKGMATTQMAAVTQTDVSGGAFAGSGSVNGAVIASTQGGGAVIAAEINVSALTLGTASAVFAILQESNGGTNFSDIWMSDPITTTGIISMPAIPVAGRRRWRFFSAGGTSTTVTATITTLELPSGSYPVRRQFRDYFAATNPLASVVNSVAQAASTLVLTSAGTATTTCNVDGCKNITAFVTVSGSPTVTTAPVLTLQLSMDGSNWASIAATMTLSASGTAMTTINTYAAKFARILVATAAVYSSGSFAITNIGINSVN